jgi:outer membrane receptor protein involved in Fe transport
MHQIEVGVKYILRQNVSTSQYNNLDYDQHILGAYAGYLFKWKKFSTKTGMRLEQTRNDGVSTVSDINTDFKNLLFNVVPYATISYMPKQGHTIKASYTQRLSRPGIWYLNPYVNNVDSMNISQGNPDLKSELSHSFSLGYSFFAAKFNFSLSSSASFLNNSIESIKTILPNGATFSTYKNIGKDQNYGLNIYASYRPNGNFNIYFNGGVNYMKLEANNGYAISNEGTGYRGSLGMRLTLWKDGSVNMDGFFYSPGVSLQGRSSKYYNTGIGVSQYLLKRKLMLSLSVSNPFPRDRKYSFESMDPTFYTYNETTTRIQNFRFGVTYNFGSMNMNVKKARRSIQNDDVKSGGGSGSSEG